MNKDKNLLPERKFEGVAPKQVFSKISIGLPKRVRWLTIFALILINLLGYYPAYNIPPIRQSVAQGEEQTGQIIAASFSKPVVLPHPGYLSTSFSSWHPGIDIAAGLGMPIHPIIDGAVTEAGVDFWGAGKLCSCCS